MAYRGFTGMARTSGTSSGRTAFGGVPAPVAVPPSHYQQVSQVYPGFTGALGTASNDILAELRGDVNLNELQDLAASLGVQSGMPLTGGADTFSGVRGLRLAEREKYNRRRQGLQDFGALEGLLAGQQTDPGLAFGVADRNAMFAAAPDPALAHEQLFNDWKRQYDLLNINPAGGTRRPNVPDSGGIPGVGHSGGGPTYAPVHTPYGGGLPAPGIPVGGGAGVSRGPADFYRSDFDWNAWMRGNSPAQGTGAGSGDTTENWWDWMYGPGDYAQILEQPDPWTD